MRDVDVSHAISQLEIMEDVVKGVLMLAGAGFVLLLCALVIFI